MTDQVRRKLLKAGAYVPPAILGIMLTSSDADAVTINCGGALITVSATGNACCPCVTNINSQKCRNEQCWLGNCVKCKKQGWGRKANCLKQAAACGCVCKKVGRKWKCQ